MSEDSTTVQIPTHPTVEAMAEAEVDADEFIASIRNTSPSPLAEVDRMFGARVVDSFVRDVLFPTFRQAFAFGAQTERLRCADWLVKLAGRAASNGSPVRANAMKDLALDLLGGVPGPSSDQTSTMADAIRKALRARK